MKSNKFVWLFGFLVALFALSFVAAGNLSVSINEVEANDVVLSSGLTLAGTASDSLPVVVRFTSNADLEDLKVKAWVEGYKNDVSASTSRFDVLSGSTYIKKLSLTLPSVQDMEDVDETLTLYVRIADKNDEVEQDYKIRLQRESYSFNVLSVEMPLKAVAGEVIPLDIVLKNIGSRELEDAFVTASISELGVQKKVYFGDLQPEDCIDDCDEEDARERRVYLIVPSDAKSGDYTVEVKATNYDTTSTVRKVLTVAGTQSEDKDGNVIDTDGKSEGIPTSILVLTVVLVIIFVVLLIVLIVLLTKKPSEKAEDFGETSYY